MSGRNRESGFPFVLPAVMLLLAVTVYPLLYVFYLSLHRRLIIFGIERFTGLDNYLFLIADLRFWNGFRNTLYFTPISVTLELLLGLSIAVLLNRDFPAKGFVRSVILVPWAVPTVVSAKMWEWMYNADFGIVNHLLGQDINWLGSPGWAMHAAIAMDVWKGIARCYLSDDSSTICSDGASPAFPCPMYSVTWGKGISIFS